MTAHLYIASLYEKRRDEFKLEELRAVWKATRKRSRYPNDDDEVIVAKRVYDDAGREALKNCHWQDEYNQNCLFWLAGLDHWAEASHAINGTMPIERIKVLRNWFAGVDIREAVQRAFDNGILNARMQPGSPARRRPELILPTNEGIEPSVEWFEKKRAALVALFDQAIALNEGIRWAT